MSAKKYTFRFMGIFLALSLTLPPPTEVYPELSQRTLRPGAGLDASDDSVRVGLEEKLRSSQKIVTAAFTGLEESDTLDWSGVADRLREKPNLEWVDVYEKAQDAREKYRPDLRLYKPGHFESLIEQFSKLVTVQWPHGIRFRFVFKEAESEAKTPYAELTAFIPAPRAKGSFSAAGLEETETPLELTVDQAVAAIEEFDVYGLFQGVQLQTASGRKVLNYEALHGEQPGLLKKGISEVAAGSRSKKVVIQMIEPEKDKIYFLVTTPKEAGPGLDSKQAISILGLMAAQVFRNRSFQLGWTDKKLAVRRVRVDTTDGLGGHKTMDPLVKKMIQVSGSKRVLIRVTIPPRSEIQSSRGSSSFIVTPLSAGAEEAGNPAKTAAELNAVRGWNIPAESLQRARRLDKTLLGFIQPGDLLILPDQKTAYDVIHPTASHVETWKHLDKDENYAHQAFRLFSTQELVGKSIWVKAHWWNTVGRLLDDCERVFTNTSPIGNGQAATEIEEFKQRVGSLRSLLQAGNLPSAVSSLQSLMEMIENVSFLDDAQRRHLSDSLYRARLFLLFGVKPALPVAILAVESYQLKAGSAWDMYRALVPDLKEVPSFLSEGNLQIELAWEKLLAAREQLDQPQSHEGVAESQLEPVKTAFEARREELQSWVNAALGALTFSAGLEEAKWQKRVGRMLDDYQRALTAVPPQVVKHDRQSEQIGRLEHWLSNVRAYLRDGDLSLAQFWLKSLLKTLDKESDSFLKRSEVVSLSDYLYRAENFLLHVEAKVSIAKLAVDSYQRMSMSAWDMYRVRVSDLKEVYPLLSEKRLNVGLARRRLLSAKARLNRPQSHKGVEASRLGMVKVSFKSYKQQLQAYIDAALSALTFSVAGLEEGDIGRAIQGLFEQGTKQLRLPVPQASDWHLPGIGVGESGPYAFYVSRRSDGDSQIVTVLLNKKSAVFSPREVSEAAHYEFRVSAAGTATDWVPLAADSAVQIGSPVSLSAQLRFPAVDSEVVLEYRNRYEDYCQSLEGMDIFKLAALAETAINDPQNEAILKGILPDSAAVQRLTGHITSARSYSYSKLSAIKPLQDFLAAVWLAKHSKSEGSSSTLETPSPAAGVEEKIESQVLFDVADQLLHRDSPPRSWGEAYEGLVQAKVLDRKGRPSVEELFWWFMGRVAPVDLRNQPMLPREWEQIRELAIVLDAYGSRPRSPEFGPPIETYLPEFNKTVSFVSDGNRAFLDRSRQLVGSQKSAPGTKRTDTSAAGLEEEEWLSPKDAMEAFDRLFSNSNPSRLFDVILDRVSISEDDRIRRLIDMRYVGAKWVTDRIFIIGNLINIRTVVEKVLNDAAPTDRFQWQGERSGTTVKLNVKRAGADEMLITQDTDFSNLKVGGTLMHKDWKLNREYYYEIQAVNLTGGHHRILARLVSPVVSREVSRLFKEDLAQGGFYYRPPVSSTGLEEQERVTMGEAANAFNPAAGLEERAVVGTERINWSAGFTQQARQVGIKLERFYGSSERFLQAGRMTRQTAQAIQPPVAIFLPDQNVPGGKEWEKVFTLAEVEGGFRQASGWREELPFTVELASSKLRLNQLLARGYRVIQVVIPQEQDQGVLTKEGLLMLVSDVYRSAIQRPFISGRPTPIFVEDARPYYQVQSLSYPNFVAGAEELWKSM